MASSLLMERDSRKTWLLKVVVETEEEVPKMRTSTQVMEDWVWSRDWEVKVREGGGRGAGGAAESAANASVHLWRVAAAFFLAAAMSGPFSTARSALASSWPRVGRQEEREEEEVAAKEADAGEEAREERRGGDEREEREER